MAIAARKSHAGGPMWPSLAAASFVSTLANWALVASLGVGVIATLLIVWMGNVKEAYWDADRQQSKERVAGLESSVANANARAAEANRVAEGERLERIKIEAGLASRHVPADRSSKLSAAFSAIRDRVPVIRIVVLGDKEASDFGKDIASAIIASGVDVQMVSIGQMAPPPYGVQVMDAPDGLIMAALKEADITATIAAQLPLPAIVLASDVPVILVGLKTPAF